jgi:capsid protein
MIPLYELDELIDATVAKQQAAQAIAWIVTNTNPMAMTPTGTPQVVKDKYLRDEIVFKAQGGNTQYLNKGEDIKFYQSTDIGQNLQTLVKSELRRIATALDIPYHQLTGDTEGLDFSSIRALGIELRTRLEYIHHFYTIPLGLAPLTKKFKELALLVDSSVATALPRYQLPRWYGVDELQDAQADLLELQMGANTLENILNERHVSFEEVVADAKRNKVLIDLGIDIYGQANAAQQNTNVKPNVKSSSS